MQSRNPILSAFGAALIGGTTVASNTLVAQEVENHLQTVALIEVRPAPQGATSAQHAAVNIIADVRSLWSDPAIRNFVGLAENAWDFNVPNSIPGFGPLP